MLNLKNNVKIDYEKNDDVLYLRLKYSEDSYGDEEESDIIINRDYNSEELLSVEIWGFKKRMESHETIKIPINIDLKEIYESLD